MINLNNAKNAAFNRYNSAKSRVGRIASRRPLITFLTILVAFVGLIALVNFLNKPAVSTETSEKAAIPVNTYKIGSAPKLSVQAKVEKSGVIDIISQSNGVIQSINVAEGDSVAKGKILVKLSTNYQGGNTQAVQSQKAKNQFLFDKDNFDLNKEAIETQKDIASENKENSEELREITRKSLDDTDKLLDLNKDLLDNIKFNISQLEAISPRTPAQEESLQGLKNQEVQLQASVNQLNETLRKNKYDSDDDHAPAKIADLQKDLTDKQLELQTKSLELQKELSKLDYNLAKIAEGLMYPAAPFAGTVEKVNIKVGQVVNPGTVLMTITGNQNSAKAIAYVTKEVANGISLAETSTVYFNDKSIELAPTYVSSEPTQGNLHSVIFIIPEEFEKDITNDSYVSVQLPIGYADTGSTVPFIPLDAVYQTQNKSYVFIVDKNAGNESIAKSKELELGEVFGNYVEVKSGLQDQDIVILDRTVSDNEKIQLEGN